MNINSRALNVLVLFVLVLGPTFAHAATPTLGAHALAFLPCDSTSTLSTTPVITQSSGSTILSWVGRGVIGSFTSATFPTDNKGNAYNILGSVNSYAPTWPGSGETLYGIPLAMGGANHIFTVPQPLSDETTLAAVEVKNGGIIQDVQWNKTTSDASTATSLNVTTTGPATLVAVWAGDSDGGVPGYVAAQPNNGFTVVDSQLYAHCGVETVLATKDVSVPGTYNVTWTHSPNQGAHLWLVAVQTASTSNPISTTTPIFQDDMSTITGGTRSFPNAIGSISSVNPFTSASAAYLNASIPAGSAQSTNLVNYTPSSAANSWSALAGTMTVGTTTYTTLNGGFDIFVRPGAGITSVGSWFRPVDVTQISGTSGMRIIFNGLSTNRLQLAVKTGSSAGLGATPGVFDKSDTFALPGAITTSIPGTFTPGGILHMAVTFSTAPSGQITMKVFEVAGAGAIDTSSDTVGVGNLLAKQSFYANAAAIGPNALPTGAWTMTARTDNGQPFATATTVDYEGLRMYNSVPANFPALLVAAPLVAGDRIVTTANLNVRGTASASGALLGTQAAGTLGTVTDGPVVADGYVWWQVNYDTGVDGWSVQDYLNKTTPIPTVVVSASSTSITSGESSLITWDSTNATSCTGTNFSTGNAMSGSLSVTPATTTTYTLTCTGAGGSASQSTTVTVTTQGAPTPLGISGTWNLIFDDEFNGTTLDTSVWCPTWVVASSCTQISVPINAQMISAYDPAQVSVSGGTLNLTAVNNPVTVGGTTYQYRSGMVQTQGIKGNPAKFEFAYGVAEARVYSPASSGTDMANWPAWWLDGQNWPYDGEIDIFEGFKTACYAFHSWSAQYGDQDWQDPAKSGCPGGNYTGWHTYGAQWENNKIDFYYDGVKVGTVTKEITASPEYLLFNYAVGNRADTPISVPSTMKVDYVRVWKGTATGGTAIPVNTAIPTISGTPQVGQTLTANPGTWTNNPTSYAYQWYKENNIIIPGATAQTYTPVAADAGAHLYLSVIATNAGGPSVAAWAAWTNVVGAAPAPVAIFQDDMTTITGGTRTFPNAIAGISSTNPFTPAGAAYLNANIPAGSAQSTNLITYTPSSAANSWAAMAGTVTVGTTTYTTLNGGFDLFVRPGSGITAGNSWLRPIDITQISGSTGMRIIFNGITNNRVQMMIKTGSTTGLGANPGVFDKGDTFGLPGAMTVSAPAAFTLGGTMHFGVTFSTDTAGKITMKLFGVSGTGAIDTSSDTVGVGNLLGQQTFYANAAAIGPNALPTGAWTMTARSDNGQPFTAATTVDYETIRLYDSKPGAFPGI